MKTCILSMQNVNNFGSVLQSYGLKRTVENLGSQVEFIDIERIEDDDKLRGNHCLDHSSERAKGGLTGKHSKVDKYLKNRLVNRKLEPVQDDLFQKCREERLDIKNKSDNYDVCIIGSDEVFNCLNPSEKWGFTSQLFGNVRQAKKVITYAASCGATTYEKLTDALSKKIRESLESISYISVRDMNTYEFTKHFVEKEITKNVDPVIMYDFTKEITEVQMPDVPAHYCLIYAYRNRIKDKREIDEIISFCKKNKLTPIAVGAPQYWIKRFVICSPFQCLLLFKNADYVITDTFHGTVFSLKYAKRFATIIRDSNRNKLLDLIHLFKAETHLVNTIKDINSIYKIEKEAYIQEIIEKERMRSIEYLKGSMF